LQPREPEIPGPRGSDKTIEGCVHCSPSRLKHGPAQGCGWGSPLASTRSLGKSPAPGKAREGEGREHLFRDTCLEGRDRPPRATLALQLKGTFDHKNPLQGLQGAANAMVDPALYSTARRQPGLSAAPTLEWRLCVVERGQGVIVRSGARVSAQDRSTKQVTPS